MAKVQAYVSDAVSEKIMAIVEKRKAEGAKDKDVSFSSISTMLLESGLRVYEAQMERKESDFNQMEYNKVLLDNVIKTQLSIAKVLGISSLSPQVSDMPKFEFKTMVLSIKDDAQDIISRFFPIEEVEDE